jgi:restriction endonuclease Mrr
MDTTAVYEALAGKMNLSEDDQLELLPSGRQAVFKNRIGSG